jgi:hypothetical protein
VQGANQESQPKSSPRIAGIGEPDSRQRMREMAAIGPSVYVRIKYSWRTLDRREPRGVPHREVGRKSTRHSFSGSGLPLALHENVWNHRTTSQRPYRLAFLRVKMRPAVMASRHQGAQLSPVGRVDAVGAVTMRWIGGRRPLLPAGAGAALGGAVKVRRHRRAASIPAMATPISPWFVEKSYTKAERMA